MVWGGHGTRPSHSCCTDLSQSRMWPGAWTVAGPSSGPGVTGALLCKLPAHRQVVKQMFSDQDKHILVPCLALPARTATQGGWPPNKPTVIAVQHAAAT